MRGLFLITAALTCAGSALAQSADEGLGLSGKVQLQWNELLHNRFGPLARANALQSGIVELRTGGAAAMAELRSSGRGWSAIATLQRNNGQSPLQRAYFNEFGAMHDAGAWQFSAGKKIVSWDVGYGFRPNDVVQNEQRRTLVSTTAEGRPVLMAERFDADSAWSLVWVNPTKPKSELGAKEPALAARVYQRQGSVDWHGFARIGAHTGGSAGGAFSWVASDAIELHGSARYLNRFDCGSVDALASGLVRADPWHIATLHHTTQVLMGGTWTSENQLSVLAEAWWDGTALSASQWDDWRARNEMLADLTVRGAPARAVAGNLAWQGDAFGASSSLQRGNLYLRLSWDHEGWQPSLDILYQPTDRGRMLTAALQWKGDRVQLQGGLRIFGGPSTAVLVQLPQRAQAFAAVTRAF